MYCSITGFGSRRRPHGRPGYDFVAQAESGLMSITGEPDGEATKVGVALIDVLTGLNASTAILAALHRRERTGEGELIEVALLDSAFASLVNVAQNALVTGEEPRRYGNAHPSIVPYQPFRASDGWIAVAAANDGLFRRLCAAIDRPELAADDRYATNDARVRNRDALVDELAAVFADRASEAWVSLLLAAGVPAGKIRGVGDALRSADAATAVPHPTAGTVELVRSPFPGARPPTAPPLLGQHTGEVLGELGVGEDRLVELERRGAIARSSPPDLSR